MSLMAMVVVALAAGGTQADPAACAAIADSAARLACYDRIFPPAAPASQGSPGSSTTPVAPAARDSGIGGLTAEDQFGLTAGQLRGQSGEEPLERLRSVVAAIEVTGTKPVVRLENGQRWRQLEATDRPVFSVGASVEIRSGALGSFLASVPGSRQPAVRVRRID